MLTPTERAIREAGLRVTQPRLAVLSALDAIPHADTQTIIEAARKTLPGVSHQAVYNCLDALTHAGLIRRIELAGSPARYELRPGDNHHHLVCRECGVVIDVACSKGVAPCLTLTTEQTQGFEIEEAEVVYRGLCPKCATTPSPHRRQLP